MKRYQLSVTVSVHGYVTVEADNAERAKRAMHYPEVDVRFPDANIDQSMLDEIGQVEIHDCNEWEGEPEA